MKYYKILREDLTHHGYAYHEGLNTDPVEWVDGECKPGGFYITTVEHIFGFVGYGDLICDVEIPEDARVVHYSEKSKADKIIVSNIRNLWDVKTIQELLEAGAYIHAFGDQALLVASEKGCLEIVKLLLEAGADVHACNDDALFYASHEGHTGVVKLLLEAGADVHACDDLALRTATANGHTEIVDLLKQYS